MFPGGFPSALASYSRSPGWCYHRRPAAAAISSAMLCLVAACSLLWTPIAAVALHPSMARRSSSVNSRQVPMSAAETLVGYDEFVRTNPMTDRFHVKSFHHVELYCADASSAAGRFAHALGLRAVARSDGSTGNQACTSLCMQSGDVRMVFTAPNMPVERDADACHTPGFDRATALSFLEKHGGLAVRAVCMEVDDAAFAFARCVEGGGTPVLEPRWMTDSRAHENEETPRAGCTVAEVQLYGDVVLRLLSFDDGYSGAHLPGYAQLPVPSSSVEGRYGITRFDHIVGNVWELMPSIRRLKAMTGFHEFAEFTAEDVGTVDSGLNSMVLACNSELVLLPLNEPTYGTRRRSQIETFLIANGGEGVQHIALKTDDIFSTVAAMRSVTPTGGFCMMDPPSDDYYTELPARIGDALEPWQFEKAQELGLLVDRDDQGILIQVFTRPVGDRPTLFLEIIQRVGCMVPSDNESQEHLVQKPGCGGFGKGNFKELFKSVELFERSLYGE